jgi:hypothetical protein
MILEVRFTDTKQSIGNRSTSTCQEIGCLRFASCGTVTTEMIKSFPGRDGRPSYS